MDAKGVPFREQRLKSRVGPHKPVSRYRSSWLVEIKLSGWFANRRAS